MNFLARLAQSITAIRARFAPRLAVATLAPHVFEPFAARFAVRRVPADTLEAAFIAGQQHVLAALKEGFVHEVR